MHRRGSLVLEYPACDKGRTYTVHVHKEVDHGLGVYCCFFYVTKLHLFTFV